MMNRLHLQIVAVGAFLIAVAFSLPASARLRVSFGDDEVVSRADLILVGGIKEGSIKYVAHPHGANEGASWEHHATLLVHRVIKGKCDEKEISITIHYGLDPLIDGHAKEEGHEFNQAVPAGAAAGIIQIVDTGNSAFGANVNPADARADNLWLLRRRPGDPHRVEAGSGDYGIIDPEDFQPLALEEYFKGYLSDDPVSAVRKSLQKQPEVAERATRFLEHREIGKILQIADLAERAERLLPYFCSRSSGYGEARKGIVAAGAVAGPYLFSVYQSHWESNVRSDVIRAWAEIRWAGSVDLLIGLLKDHDQFWAGQKLDAGWWNANVDSILTQRRRDSYGEIYSAVYALGQIGDARAKEAIELTRERWMAIKFENPQIVEECDRAMKQFAEGARGK